MDDWGVIIAAGIAALLLVAAMGIACIKRKRLAATLPKRQNRQSAGILS